MFLSCEKLGHDVFLQRQHYQVKPAGLSCIGERPSRERWAFLRYMGFLSAL